MVARGLGLILGGGFLIVAGRRGVGWQVWGTTWVSERRHEQIATELEQEWRAGAQLVQVEEGPATAMVEIPAFGKDYRVPLLEGTSEEVLAAGFGHPVDTQAPGQLGNLVLSGHRITHGEPLADMPDLEPGDEVIVTTAHTTYTYVLGTGGDDLTVDLTDTWVLDPARSTPTAASSHSSPAASQDSGC